MWENFWQVCVHSQYAVDNQIITALFVLSDKSQVYQLPNLTKQGDGFFLA